LINTHEIVCPCRVLQADICPKLVTKKGFEALSKLQSLQVFVFVFVGRPDSIKDLMLKWCYILMPQLHVAAFKPEPGIPRKLLQTLGSGMSKALRLFTRHDCTLHAATAEPSADHLGQNSGKRCIAGIEGALS
jgi:hypothetical protein